MQKVIICLFLSTNTAGKAKNAEYKYRLIYKDYTPLEDGGMLKITTGPRLALTCMLEALKHMTRPSDITIFTDSKYLDGNFKRLTTWDIGNGKRSNGRKLKNADLWKELHKWQQPHDIKILLQETMEPYRE